MTMLNPYNGSQARKVFGLLTGVCKYMFEVQSSPSGHGVGSGRNSVGVPPTVKIVDVMLAVVVVLKVGLMSSAFLLTINNEGDEGNLRFINM